MNVTKNNCEVIAVDVGNTHFRAAWVIQGSIKKRIALPSKLITEKRIDVFLRQTSGRPVAACSVVPRITRMLKKKKVLIAGDTLKVPIISRYKAKQAGADRLAGAYAAMVFYPGTRVILDFGTAVTIDFLSSKGDYLGGVILPGLTSAQEALSRCALLKGKVKMGPVPAGIPKTTEGSVSKGLIEGFSLMIEAMIARYAKYPAVSKKNPVIITGGDVRQIINRLKFSFVYDPELVFKGLACACLEHLSR